MTRLHSADWRTIFASCILRRPAHTTSKVTAEQSLPSFSMKIIGSTVAGIPPKALDTYDYPSNLRGGKPGCPRSGKTAVSV
jgi:hypothetical protein